jgi:hypothetical protein
VGDADLSSKQMFAFSFRRSLNVLDATKEVLDSNVNEFLHNIPHSLYIQITPKVYFFSFAIHEARSTPCKLAT